MVVKIIISSVSGNYEVKSRQQRVLSILDSKNIEYELLDIAGEESVEIKEFMKNATSYGGTMSDPNPQYPLPPQIFSDEHYCGDYDMFDTANEIGEMKKFLRLTDGHEGTNIENISEINLIMNKTMSSYCENDDKHVIKH
ncbi:unnamed protein product [Phaedon cochleariae]|uniref:Uncharacterized protein n=1 Tax=Phaedon cochleariae TaxID=80249 RepID=A0A9P0DH65_PHACE|nr:unnamed protein product [Phaedon cochleariae]